MSVGGSGHGGSVSRFHQKTCLAAQLVSVVVQQDDILGAVL